MSSISSIASRSTLLLTGDRMLASVNNTQNEISQVQEEISTGNAVNKPSDSPAKVAAIELLQGQLENRQQTDDNLSFATSVLDGADQAMSDATDILNQAHSVGSSQVGVGSDQSTRANQSIVVDQNLQGFLNSANQRVQGIPLFGGSASPLNDPNHGDLFVSFLGGVRYVGNQTNLTVQTGMHQPLAINSNGVDSFGALSSRVQGNVDLNPQATADTQLGDLGGARQLGVAKGVIQVTVDGAPLMVDLNSAQTLGDVVVRINHAIAGVDNTAGAVGLSGSSVQLAANAGHTISISDIGAGVTAADLGVATTANSATVTGGDLNPKLTLFTNLSSLGASVDWSGGLKITQGAVTKIADFSGATTVQDLMNDVNKLNLGVRLQINARGTGLDMTSDVSGISMSIGENGGGTTATDLGLRSLGLNTSLADFNNGLGVSHPAGQNDFSITVHNGTTFNVNLDGATTVADVINKIKTAAGGAGLTVGNTGDVSTDLNVGLVTDGNGLDLEDGTLGASEFKVTQLGTSLAATDLGIYTNAGAGSAIIGQDRALVRVNSVFTHLIDLRNALQNNDSTGITLATGSLEKDLDQVTNARANIGARAQSVTQQQNVSSQMKVTEKSMLSDLQGADLTEVLTRFTQLQQQLQASLQSGAKLLQNSLLDYLR